MAEKILQSQHARPAAGASRLSPAPGDRDPRARGARSGDRRHREPRAGRRAGHGHPRGVRVRPAHRADDPVRLRHQRGTRGLGGDGAARLRRMERVLHPVRRPSSRPDTGQADRRHPRRDGHGPRRELRRRGRPQSAADRRRAPAALPHRPAAGRLSSPWQAPGGSGGGHGRRAGIGRTKRRRRPPQARGRRCRRSALDSGARRRRVPSARAVRRPPGRSSSRPPGLGLPADWLRRLSALPRGPGPERPGPSARAARGRAGPSPGRPRGPRGRRSRHPVRGPEAEPLGRVRAAGRARGPRRAGQLRLQRAARISPPATAKSPPTWPGPAPTARTRPSRPASSGWPRPATTRSTATSGAPGAGSGSHWRASAPRR